MGHKSVNPVFFLENWQSAESWYRWNSILLVYCTFFFFTVYLSKHHPSQHVVASCIHVIQIHLSQVWKKKCCSRLLLLRLINIDNYFAFSIFKPSSNYLYLKNKFISFFFYTMYVYKYLKKINTFTVRNYYTSWYPYLGKYLLDRFFLKPFLSF